MKKCLPLAEAGSFRVPWASEACGVGSPSWGMSHAVVAWPSQNSRLSIPRGVCVCVSAWGWGWRSEAEEVAGVAAWHPSVVCPLPTESGPFLLTS